MRDNLRYNARPIGPVRGGASEMGPEEAELARALAGMAAPLIRGAARQRTAESARAGRASGLAGNLDPIAGGSSADLAFADAQESAYVQRLHSDVRAHAGVLAAKYPEDPDGFADEFDQWSERVVGMVKPEVRDLVAGELSLRRNAEVSAIQQRFAANEAGRQQEVRAEFEKDLEADALLYARRSDQAALNQTMAKFNTHWEEELAARRMLPEQVEQARANLTEKMMAEVTIVSFEESLQAGRGQAYYERFRNGGAAPELRLGQIDRLTNYMKAGLSHQRVEANHAIAQQNRQRGENDRFLSYWTPVLEAGGVLPPEVQKQWDSLTGSRAPVDPSKYDTVLAPEEEAQFQQWRAANVNPQDSGQDYDFRGAWKAGETSSVSPVDGKPHWSDRFKKPNHPTFSVESVYAKDRPDLAGSWNGETYSPARDPRPFALASPRSLDEARAAQDTLDISRDVATMPAERFEALKLALGSAQPETPYDVERLKIIRDRVAKRESGLAADPMEWAMKSSPEAFPPVVLPPDVNAPEFDAGLAQLASNAGMLSSLYGVEASPLTKGQKQLFATALTSMSAEEQAVALGKINTAFGDRAHLVYEDLNKQGATTLAYAGWRGGTGDLDTAGAILNGRAAIVAGLPVKPKEMERSSALGEIYAAAPHPELVAQIAAATDALFADRVAKGDDQADYAALLNEIAPIGKYNGKALLLPRRAPDETAFADAIEQVSEEEIVAMGGVPGIAAILRDGRATLTSVGADRYLVDINGVAVRRPDGREFELDFEKVSAKPSRAGVPRRVMRAVGGVIDTAVESAREDFYSGQFAYGLKPSAIRRGRQ